MIGPEPHGLIDTLPKQPASPLTATGEQEEIVLSSVALSQNGKDSDRGADTVDAAVGQKMANLAINILIIALCLLFLLFCYRKINRHAAASQHDPPAAAAEAVNARLQTKHFSAEPFQIERTIWYYAEEEQEYADLRLLYEANNRRFAKISNYSFVPLNKLTAREHLPDSIVQQLQSLEKELNFQSENKRIIRVLTLLHVLHRHGGVAISENILMTQSLGWLENVRASPYLNGDFNGQRVQLVAFFSPQMSSEPEMVEWGWAKKHASTALALQNYFLAADKGAPFMQELLKRLVSGLTNQQTIAKVQKQMTPHPSRNFFDTLFQNTCLQIFREKGVNSVLFYGVAAINEALSAAKMNRQMDRLAFRQRMALLSRLSLYELQETFGEFRYFTVMKHEAELLLYVTTATASTAQHTVMEDSFIRFFLLAKNKPPQVYANSEQDTVLYGQPWKGLPKIVWVYYPEGIQKGEVLEYLIAQRIKSAAETAGYQFKQLNDSNLAQYISEDLLQKIDTTLRNHPNRNQDTKSQLVRLAVIAQKGGVYIDSSIVLLEDLTWLTNIASGHSSKLMQRCGSLPKNFLFWDVFQTRPLAWSISECNTKSPVNPFFMSSFMAAEPQSPLFTQWLHLYLDLLSKPQQEAQYTVQNCADIYQRTPHSLSAASLGCVMKERQKQTAAPKDGNAMSASQFYELWSMNGVALNKAAPPFLAQRDLISEITQKPMEYLQQLNGFLGEMVRLSDLQMQQLNDFIIQHHENIHQYVHPSSLVAKHILPPEGSKLVYVKGALRVQRS